MLISWKEGIIHLLIYVYRIGQPCVINLK